MWTERDKILCNFGDIENYIQSMDSFHDYRFGGIEIKENVIRITIEEDKHQIDNRDALIWVFTFQEISEFETDLDCVVTPYVTEIDTAGHDIMISLTNGYIFIKSNYIRLGIPKQASDNIHEQSR
ncbi:MAG: hypothetical protein ACI4J5_03050 [Oscillospiraceae bacterium]